MRATPRTIDVGGRRRRFRLRIPAAVRGRVPCVLQLHGGGGSSRRIERLTGFEALAERRGFIVASPAAVRGFWNDGRYLDSTAARTGVDDVGFMAALVQTLDDEGLIDARRVFAVGMSNGAFMTQRLACELPRGTLAGIALVAGTAPAERAANAGSDPVPVIAFHGTADPVVPYNGGEVRTLFTGRPRGRAMGVDELARWWAIRNGCSDDPIDRRIGLDVVERAWTTGHAPVVFHAIEGGGHTWPGRRPHLPSRVIGTSTTTVDATSMIWTFFSAVR